MARLGRAVEMYEWVCLAYCLLDTHFHLVLQTPEPNLGVGMRWLQSVYAQDVNYRHARRGHLFGGRFYSARLKGDNHLLSAVIYVLLNPVRAGVAKHPEDWPWCSYVDTVARETSPRFLARAAVLELFDSRPSAARLRLAEAVRETLARDAH